MNSLEQSESANRRSPASGGSALIAVERMWVGDRFRAHGSLWTYLGASDEKWGTARRHSPESIALNDRGYGYIGDTICSFERGDVVEFVAPNEKAQ